MQMINYEKDNNIVNNEYKLAYTSDTEAVKRTVLNNKWFDPNEVIIVEAGGLQEWT